MFFLLSAGIVFAKEEQPLGEFSGKGLAKSPPDFISLTISVHSTCQPSPRDAQVSTDAVVKEINDYLQKLKSAGDKYFKILVDGGFTSAYSRLFKNREFCRNTFQKVTNITLNLAMRSDFDAIFSDLQTYLLSQFDQSLTGDDSEISQTYVSINAPQATITHHHRILLEREALDLALRDAKANFKAAIKSCAQHPWKVFSIREEGGGHQPIFRAVSYARAPMQNDSAAQGELIAPISFDLIEVTKNLTVTFQFEGAQCFEP